MSFIGLQEPTNHKTGELYTVHVTNKCRTQFTLLAVLTLGT